MPKSASTQQHIFNFQFSIINCPLIIIFLMTTFLLTSCEKEPYKACKEDPTCEYLRCKVNGEWWTPDCEQGPLFGCDHTDVQYYRYLNGGGLSIYSSKASNRTGIILTSNNVRYTNTSYNLYRQGKYSEFYLKNTVLNSWDSYYLDTTNFNKLIITYIDTVDFILKGNFTFTGKNENGNTVSITEGEFRYHYRF